MIGNLGMKASLSWFSNVDLTGETEGFSLSHLRNAWFLSCSALLESRVVWLEQWTSASCSGANALPFADTYEDQVQNGNMSESS